MTDIEVLEIVGNPQILIIKTKEAEASENN